MTGQPLPCCTQKNIREMEKKERDSKRSTTSNVASEMEVYGIRYVLAQAHLYLERDTGGTEALGHTGQGRADQSLLHRRGGGVLAQSQRHSSVVCGARAG